MNRSFSYCSRLVILMLPAAVSIAQTNHTNVFTGTWKLNVAKSNYNPGPPLQNATVTIEPDGTFIMNGVDENGKPIKWSHPWSVGNEVPVKGIPHGSVISKLQDRTGDDTMKIGGKTVQTVHAVVSSDGQSISASVDGTDRHGHPVHNVEVYEKQ